MFFLHVHYWLWLVSYIVANHHLPGIDLLLGA